MYGRVALALGFAAVLHAHVVSMSTGELRVDGPTATFELRMPMYEVAHVKNPETTLLDHVQFNGGRRVKSSCVQEGDTYVCTASYEFAALLPDKLDVDCTLYQVTVPNHIHLLTAKQGSNGDQLVFDQNTPQGELRFRPPSAVEIFFRDVTRGGWRLATSVGAMLFLVGMAFAARSWREAVGFAAVLLVAEWISPPIAGKLPVTLAPSFFEAALALALGYLAVEMLFLPEGGGRWVAVLCAGAFVGLSFAGFPREYLTGANAVQVAMLAIASAVALRVATQFRRAAGAVLLVTGVGWFAARVLR